MPFLELGAKSAFPHGASRDFNKFHGLFLAVVPTLSFDLDLDYLVGYRCFCLSGCPPGEDSLSLSLEKTQMAFHERKHF